jgi:hypothetical protein
MMPADRFQKVKIIMRDDWIPACGEDDGWTCPAPYPRLRRG